jgi:hypothetical protein
MPTPEDFIRFTLCSPEVAAFTGKPAPEGFYNKLKAKAYDGAIPAVLLDRHWGFYRKDLPAVCAALGMSPAARPLAKPSKIAA